MGRKRDTSWRPEFLRLVTDGATFREAAAKLGVGNATVSEHFRFDRAFHAQAKQARKTRLHGPAPGTSWHPRLPGLPASGLPIPQAARRVGRSAITVRAHLRRYADLREAVNAALVANGLPCLSQLCSGEPRPVPDRCGVRIDEVSRYEKR